MCFTEMQVGVVVKILLKSISIKSQIDNDNLNNNCLLLSNATG